MTTRTGDAPTLDANPSSAVETLAAALQEGFRQAAPRHRGGILNEAGTIELLILPALTELGYSAARRIPQHGRARNVIDESCFLREVGSSAGQAVLIVEAKQYGTDFDSGLGRSESPDRQLQRYLRQHDASGPNTFGALTDGVRWRLYRRSGNPSAPDLEFIVEHDFQPIAEHGKAALESPEIRERLSDLVGMLARERIEASVKPSARPRAANPADLLFAAVAAGRPPEYLVREMLGDPDASVQFNLEEDAPLLGRAKDAHDADWESYAYAGGPPLRSAMPSLAGKRAVVAAAQFRHHPNYGLARSDAAICARTFASVDESGVAVVLAHCIAPDGAAEARVAIAAGGHVNMTAAFDPTLPSPAARAAVAKLLPLLRGKDDDLTAAALTAPLEAAPLRQQFYKDVAAWVERMQRGKDLEGRQAVLRHLVRVMFAWILKEEGIIPPELFERAFAANLPDPDRYHKDALGFLFLKRLNVPPDKRERHSIRAVGRAMEQAPFLNGSLFAEHSADDALDVPAREYWSADEERPGLFTILSRYYWTMDEHRPGESEQTLDPELLSNLFERLIAPTEKGESPLRQPAGTYYTPADVADEMVKDALAAAVKDVAPDGVSEARLREMFGAADAPLTELTDAERAALAERVAELRIFDPAVGSGEFLFSALLALMRALRNLGRDAEASPDGIIRRQLVGQDIHPLAVQIARLRLFIAITAARKSAPSDAPLPNLEARIVCADTLKTVASHEWRPGQPGRLDTADPELVAALTAVAENRALWFDAYTEDAKQELLRRDRELRGALQLLLRRNGELASPELVQFAESHIVEATPAPSGADARLLFYENPWRGFDVVIGNPPYEALNKSLNDDEINLIGSAKRYRTTNAGNLYPLFCEAALALANPEGGVVTMVVPTSVAARASHRPLRAVFEERCASIRLRHYDNRPDPIFNISPTVRSPENRQRATILTAIAGQSPQVEVWTTGLQRMPSAEREQALRLRPEVRAPGLSASDVRISGQWPRIPTPEVSEMVGRMLDQEKTVGDYGAADGATLSIPNTAYMYVSYLPQGVVSPRIETPFTVADDDALCLVMAALNGHVGYAWWSIFGDGLNLTLYQTTSMAIPDTWGTADRDAAISLGRRLADAAPDCLVRSHRIGGREWPNVDFHAGAPDLIEEADRLYIAALGLPAEPLLTQLRIMRSSSSWNYNRAWSPEPEVGDPDDDEDGDGEG